MNTPLPRFLWMIWGALLLSIGVYFFVISTFSQSGEDTVTPEDGIPTAILIAAAAVNATLTIVIRLVYQALRMRPSETPAKGLMSAEKFPVMVGILVWALSEGVAVYGLIAAFSNHDPHVFTPFGVSALALMVVHNPRFLLTSRFHHPGPPTGEPPSS